jgi:hypothetical protein
VSRLICKNGSMSANGAKRTMKLPDRMSAIHLGANLANGHQVLDSIH